MKDKKDLLYALDVILKTGDFYCIPPTEDWVDCGVNTRFRVTEARVFLTFHSCEYKLSATVHALKAFRKRVASNFTSKSITRVNGKTLANPYKPKSPTSGPLRKLTKKEQTNLLYYQIFGV